MTLHSCWFLLPIRPCAPSSLFILDISIVNDRERVPQCVKCGVDAVTDAEMFAAVSDGGQQGSACLFLSCFCWFSKCGLIVTEQFISAVEWLNS